MILHVTEIEVSQPHRLNLSFSDGTSGTVDVRPLLRGPVFEPVKDPSTFAQARLDPVARTVVWPNGADLAPEALFDLLILQRASRATHGELSVILHDVKRAARRYQALTGRPLGITGEVAEIEAVEKLGLTPTPVRHRGYDALRLGAEGVERIQIKGRRVGETGLGRGRIGRLHLEHPWDSVLLVLLDDSFNATAIYEADRPLVERALSAPGSRARTERGQLAVREFLRIGRPVWSRN